MLSVGTHVNQPQFGLRYKLNQHQVDDLSFATGASAALQGVGGFSMVASGDSGAGKFAMDSANYVGANQLGELVGKNPVAFGFLSILGAAFSTAHTVYLQNVVKARAPHA